MTSPPRATRSLTARAIQVAIIGVAAVSTVGVVCASDLVEEAPALSAREVKGEIGGYLANGSREWSVATGREGVLLFNGLQWSIRTITPSGEITGETQLQLEEGGFLAGLLGQQATLNDGEIGTRLSSGKSQHAVLTDMGKVVLFDQLGNLTGVVQSFYGVDAIPFKRKVLVSRVPAWNPPKQQRLSRLQLGNPDDFDDAAEGLPLDRDDRVSRNGAAVFQTTTTANTSESKIFAAERGNFRIHVLNDDLERSVVLYDKVRFFQEPEEWDEEQRLASEEIKNELIEDHFETAGKSLTEDVRATAEVVLVASVEPLIADIVWDHTLSRLAVLAKGAEGWELGLIDPVDWSMTSFNVHDLPKNLSELAVSNTGYWFLDKKSTGGGVSLFYAAKPINFDEAPAVELAVEYGSPEE